MPTEDEYNDTTIPPEEPAGGNAGPNWIAGLADIATSDEAQGARDTVEVILGGNYDRSLTFPATRPPWEGGRITEGNRAEWLDKASRGMGGPFPSAERKAAVYFLASPNDPQVAWDRNGVLSANPGSPPTRRVDALLWDLYTLAGFTGVDTPQSSTSPVSTGGSGMSRPSGSGRGTVNPDFFNRDVGQAGRNGSTTGVLGGGDTPGGSGESDSTLLYIGVGAAVLATLFALRGK